MIRYRLSTKARNTAESELVQMKEENKYLNQKANDLITIIKQCDYLSPTERFLFRQEWTDTLSDMAVVQRQIMIRKQMLK